MVGRSAAWGIVSLQAVHHSHTSQMIVYKDLISGDEMAVGKSCAAARIKQISDSYKIEPVTQDGEEVAGLFQADSAISAIGSGAIDIGCGNAFGGAGEDEAVDDSVEKENNISGAHSFAYTPMPFGSKGEFKGWVKEYVRKVRQEMKGAGVAQEEIKKFMDEAPVFVKWLVDHYDDLEFYMGKSMNPDAGMAFAYYKDGAIAPTFVYIRSALKVIKF